ncbi:ATPase, partial [candidate division MSBL1 archaeon SCGC-AAA259I14]
MSDDVGGGARIVAFTGKGGVGKTTCSSATALHLADRGEKTLLVSSDPSPSLSDILEQNVSGEITDVRGVDCMSALEMDYDMIAERWKDKFGEEVYEVASSFLPVDREIIDYFANAPGIPEEFAIAEILEHYEGNRFDRLVWDTAPAGGTLSLIKLQDKFYGHLGDAVKLYVRIKDRLRSLVEGEVKKSPMQIISEWRQLAQDCLDMITAEDTKFYVVTIPESIGVNETERIIDNLNEFNLNVEKVIVNYLLTDAMCNCKYHSRRADMQERHLNQLRKAYECDPGLVLLPRLPDEIKG